MEIVFIGRARSSVPDGRCDSRVCLGIVLIDMVGPIDSLGQGIELIGPGGEL